MQTAKRSGIRYLPEVDGLRCVAISLVLLWHWGPTALTHVAQWGQIGVRLFFVISGFLITGILLRAKSSGFSPGVSLQNFYGRRFLRIFPPYYAVLVISVAIHIPGIRNSGIWHAAYLSNFYFAYRNDWTKLAPLWSLAVEEQFYLLWPWIVFFISEQWLKRLSWIMLITGVASRIGIRHFTHHVIAATVLLPSCVDSLGTGALLAIYGSDFTRFVKPFLVVGGLLFAATCADYMRRGLSTFVIGFNDLGVAMLSVCVLWAIVVGRTGIFGVLLRSRPVVGIGMISYGIYLYHPLAEYLFENPILRPTISLMAAGLSWFALERPILRLKRYFPNLPPSSNPVCRASIGKIERALNSTDRERSIVD